MQVIALFGPTGVGKTAVAIGLASMLGLMVAYTLGGVWLLSQS